MDNDQKHRDEKLIDVLTDLPKLDPRIKRVEVTGDGIAVETIAGPVIVRVVPQEPTAETESPAAPDRTEQSDESSKRMSSEAPLSHTDPPAGSAKAPGSARSSASALHAATVQSYRSCVAQQSERDVVRNRIPAQTGRKCRSSQENLNSGGTIPFLQDWKWTSSFSRARMGGIRLWKTESFGNQFLGVDRNWIL